MANQQQQISKTGFSNCSTPSAARVNTSSDICEQLTLAGYTGMSVVVDETCNFLTVSAHCPNMPISEGFEEAVHIANRYYFYYFF